MDGKNKAMAPRIDCEDRFAKIDFIETTEDKR